MLVTSFWFGNIVERFRPNIISGLGLALTGLSTATFGLLTYLPKYQFITGSLILRILESLGATAFATSSYSFVSVCFPDHTATMFATLEMFFGLGVIVGPIVGGILYDFAGFLLPFFIQGTIIAISGIVLLSEPIEKLFEYQKQISQRNVEDIEEPQNMIDDLHADANNVDVNISMIEQNDQISSSFSEDQNPVTLYRFLSSIIVIIDMFLIVTAVMLVAFIGATLEPFIRHQHLSNKIIYVNLMFVALGASYSMFALFIGKICDKFPSYQLSLLIIGSIITGIGEIFLGPIPLISETIFKPSLWSIAGCLILFGLGTGCKQVVAYTHVSNYTIKNRKFPANQKTYALISGMFFFCLSFGGFIGPIVAGSLVQWWNFQYGTFVMFLLELFVLLILIIQFCIKYCYRSTVF